MIEALTPQLLMVGLLMATVLASLLTLLVAAVVLLAYRGRVLRAMAERAAPGPMSWPLPAAGGGGVSAQAETAIAATRRAAWSVTAAGAAFALVFAVATVLAFPTLRSVGRFFLVLWVCAWPIVPALLTTFPARRRTRLLLMTGPLLLWALVSLLFGAAAVLAPRTFGHSVLEYFYTITPPQALAGWLLANAPPTLMWWLFSNRRLRAVGPLVLGFATALAAGGLTLLMWLLLTNPGAHWLTGIVGATGLPALAVMTIVLLLLLLASAGAGWAFMYRARQAYRRKRANDQSLMLDALWLLFAVWYAMVLVLAGVPWLLTAPLGYGVYKLALHAAQRQRGSPAAAAASSLVFLRVFSLGRRSDQLFDRLTRYWRHLASVDLICGPDIAHSTVQPHQLMDFLAGRLAAHFVVDPASLEKRLAERDLAPDHDGRYRVNSFYCHADTWTHVLPTLVSGPVVVLMDLRSLSDNNSGCVQELHHLVAAVPLQRCVLVTDATTDQAFLQRTLASAWQAMPAASPNHDATPGEVPVDRLTADEGSMRALLSRLCAATQATVPVPQ